MPDEPDDGDDKTLRVDPPSTSRRARRCPECGRPFSGEARFCPFDGDPLVDAPDWNPSADALIGQTIDQRYEVLGVLGEGGMGTVYEVRHKALGRHFALKVLRREIAQDGGLARRFIQEAKAAAAIGHPNIVAVSDFGELAEAPGAPRVPYFVMELLKGTSLAKLLAVDGRLEPRRAARIALQCASALAAAHEAGVVHRDIKPDNVFLVVAAGRTDFVKLLDFGVAKIAGAGRLTRHGTVYGTPHYMSPEQAAGNELDGRSDIYALGVVLYECLAGRVPFEADTYMGVLTKHMFATPEPLERLVPEAVDLGALGPIVARCLGKEPGDRYATMTELAQALELALTAPQEAAAAALRDGPGTRAPLRLREPSSAPPSRPRPEDEDDGGLPPIATDRLLSVGLGAMLALAAAGLVGILLRASPRPGPVAPRAPTTNAATVGATATTTGAADAPAPASAPAVDAPAPGGASSAATAAPISSAAAPARTGDPARGPEPRPPRRPREPAGAGASPPARGGDIVDPWSR